MCPAARKTDVREEYYSAIKKNEIMPCAATWTDLEIIILSEVGQIKTSYGITYLQNLKKKNELFVKENELFVDENIQT